MFHVLFSRAGWATVLNALAAGFFLSLAPAPAAAQYAVPVVMPAQPVYGYAYVPERAGLFGLRTVYRPVVTQAYPAATYAPVTTYSPVTTFSPVTAYSPITTYAPTTAFYAPPVVLARPVVAAPAPILAPAAPVTTLYAPAPLTAGWYSPPANAGILSPPATNLPAASVAPTLAPGSYTTTPGAVTSYYAPLTGTITAPAPLVGTAQAPAPVTTYYPPTTVP